MNATFLADEDFDQRIAAKMRVLGYDVLTLGVLGLAGIGLSDAAVLSIARTEGRAILTHNRLHFLRLHRQSRDHAGILVSSHARDPHAQADRIHQVLLVLPAIAGQLVRVNLSDHTIE